MGPAPQHQKQRNVLTYILMAVVGILLLVTAYFVTIKDSFWYFIFKEAGFALIVALFLVATIERFTRERHEAAAEATMNEINRHLFYAIFKRYIPEKVFEEVERSVMEANVFRTAHQLNYTIEARGVDKVTCIAQTSYQLESVLDEAALHNIVISLEMPIEVADRAGCYIEKLEVGNVVLDQKALAKYVTESDDHITVTYPYRIEGRATVRVSTLSHLVKKATDVELWASRIPSDGLELTVSTPDRNLRVCAHANHSMKLVPVMSNGVTSKWTLQHGIFPYQSLMFWWLPKEALEKPASSPKTAVDGTDT